MTSYVVRCCCMTLFAIAACLRYAHTICRSVHAADAPHHCYCLSQFIWCAQLATSVSVQQYKRELRVMNDKHTIDFIDRTTVKAIETINPKHDLM
jgi:hypothetical protein